MDRELMRRRLAAAPVGHLASAGADGKPHVVPVCFALDGDTVYWAIDFKPKGGPDLKRMRNLGENPRAALLVDHYEEDWSRLWWVRVDCSTTAPALGDEVGRGLDLLAAKYRQYRDRRPDGPVVRMEIDRWSGWSGEPSREVG
jgi:PPOX class probable F420-dependent enzyme